MTTKLARINTYFAAAVLLLLVAATGCASNPKSKEEKDRTLLSLHLQTDQEGGPKIKHVAVFRQAPMYVNIESDPYVDSGSIEGAAVLDDAGAFSIQLKFNNHGAMQLDQMTSGNHGKRVIIFCKWDDEIRWIGAKVINRRSSDGIFVFTPDATREEAGRIVRGLNNVAKELKKKDKF